MPAIALTSLVVIALAGSDVRQSRESYDERVIQATAQLRRGLAAEALILAENAGRTRPDAAPAYIVKGMALFTLGREREAGREFLRGMKLAAAPKEREEYIHAIENVTGAFNSKAESQLVSDAIAAHNVGKLAGAKKFLEEAVRRNPKNATTWFELGRVQIDSDETSAAIASLEKAREINPTSPSLLQELRNCYKDARQYDKFRAVVEDEIAIGGDQKQLLQEIAVSHAAEGDAKRAISVLSATIKRFPAYAPPYYTIGQVYFDLIKDQRRGRDYFCLFLRKASAGGDALEGLTVESANALIGAARKSCD
jgi:tetratricopeptide (TPR) repeat protein